MELMDLMRKRYSCRKFSDKPITDEQLNMILEAGRIAPSAINRQPWRFLVLNDESSLAKVDKCTKSRYGAPVAVLISFDNDASAKNPEVTPDYGWIDCALAMMQMALEAENLGLATCIVGAYDPTVARDEFNVPDNYVTYQFLMIGHADAEPSKMHDDRHALDEIVAYKSY